MKRYIISITLDSAPAFVIDDWLYADSLEHATELATTRYLELPATITVEPDLNELPSLLRPQAPGLPAIIVGPGAIAEARKRANIPPLPPTDIYDESGALVGRTL